MNDRVRWSDKELSEFHRQFQEHVKQEEEVHKMQREVHEALFRKEDKDTGIQPGVLQLLTQVSVRVREIEISDDRRKHFVGGAVFIVSCVGFVFTDTFHNIWAFIKAQLK